MATVIQPVDQPVLMDGVSWHTYEALLADGGDHRRTRMAFDQGVLEIVTPNYEHEHVENIVTRVAEALMNARRQDYAPAGSTTFKNQGTERGFEPDASYYVEHAAQVRGLTCIDLEKDPRPDLVIEIAVTHASMDKLPVYASLGVPEVWRHNAGSVQMYRLAGSSYVEVHDSTVIPGLSAARLTGFVRDSLTSPRPDWWHGVETWVRETIARECDSDR
ncbi:MAG: Uma2 family endonuclease [Candidatus Tectomicrobia bacterium]|nr:Uma2 family endonuclease [Candidatus Tectomicrobia bacterium]